VTFRCGSFQNIPDKRVQGFPLAQSAGHKYLMERRIEPKIEGSFERGFRFFADFSACLKIATHALPGRFTKE